MLHYILKCIHLEWRWLFGPFRCKYKLFGLLSTLLASLMRNYFPKQPSGAPLHTLSKLYDVPVGFVTPPPILRLNIAYFAVAEGWLLLDIGWFVLFMYSSTHPANVHELGFEREMMVRHRQHWTSFLAFRKTKYFHPAWQSYCYTHRAPYIPNQSVGTVTRRTVT